MDETYIRQHDVIGRYLSNKLPFEEHEAFEQYYFEHPEILKELELERALRSAAQKVTWPPYKKRFSLRQWLETHLPVTTNPYGTVLAAAAAVVLAVVLAVQQPMQSGAMGPSPIVGSVDLVRMRGSEPERPTLQIPAEGVVALNVDVLGFDPASTSARLTGPGGTLDDLPLEADEYGLARVALPAERLPPGDYVLEISDASGQMLDYEFTVTR
jgi:hypothetical protein